MDSTKAKKQKTLPLKDIPSDVDQIVRDEQLRLELFERQALKKEQVVYHIIKDWLKMKNEQNHT